MDCELFYLFFLEKSTACPICFLFKWTKNHGAKFNFYLNQSLFFFINKKNFIENQYNEKLSLIWDGRKSRWLYNKAYNLTQMMTKMTYVIVCNLQRIKVRVLSHIDFISHE